MKNALLITFSIILFCSCKKESTYKAPTIPNYTSNDTVVVTLTDTAILSKNSNGNWVVTGTSSMSPAIPAIVLSGELSYQVYDNGQFKFTQTDNATLGKPTTDILPPNITNPTLQEIVWEPITWYSTSNVFYDLHIQ